MLEGRGTRRLACSTAVLYNQEVPHTLTIFQSIISICRSTIYPLESTLITIPKACIPSPPRRVNCSRQHQIEEPQLHSPQLLQLITSASTTTVALHKSNNSRLPVRFTFLMDRLLWACRSDGKKTKESFVVRRLAVGPTSHWKPARDSNPESSDFCATIRAHFQAYKH
jgi:hypothetical protein